MKSIKYITVLVASLCLFASCDMDIEKAKLSPVSGFQAPTLLPQGNVIVDDNNMKTEGVTFNWSSASFGPSVQIEYALYASANGNNALIGTSFTNSLSISKTDLNGLVCNDLGFDPNVQASISAYLVASVYGTDVQAVTSNSIAFTVTTFAAELRSLYLPGNYQAWAVETAPQFFETAGGSNVYNILLDLNDGSEQYSYFKVTVAPNWSDENWGYNSLTPSWYCPEQADSNLSVDLTEGSIVELSVNRSNMTIDRTVVDGVGMCGAFDAWAYATNGDLPLTYDPVENVWTSPAVTFNETDGLGFLIRLNTAHDTANWDFKYGTNNETSSAIPGGVLLEKGAGDINVPAAGTYVMKLYGNRTPYVLVMEKQ